MAEPIGGQPSIAEIDKPAKYRSIVNASSTLDRLRQSDQ
jgi:hypothetical protein